MPVACIGLFSGVTMLSPLRARRSTLSHRKSRAFPRRVFTKSPAACRSVHTIEMKYSPTHCVVESGGSDESTLYYQYSFSDVSPGGLALPDFESDGVKLYISKSATKAKRSEKESPVAAVEPVPSGVEPAPETRAQVKSRILGAVSAAVRVVEEIAHKSEVGNVEKVEKVQEEVKKVEKVEAPELPPTTFPVNETSSIRHCVYEDSAGATVYNFTEDAPSSVGKPVFEAAGIKAYVNRVSRVTAVQTAILPEPIAKPEPVAAPEAAAARNMVSSPGSGVGGAASGKSGVAVFERSVGIAAWQGLETGYEVDLVLEVPASKPAVPVTPVEAVALEAASASTVEKKIWLAEAVTSLPRGERQTRSGATVFADGVGFVTFRNAVTEIDSDTSSAAPIRAKTVALKEARSVTSGGVGFSAAGSGSASWRRPAETAKPASEEMPLTMKPKEDFATVAVWASCGLLLAFKLLIKGV